MHVGRLASLAALLVFGTAHVGSPDAWMEANAGPYHVIVNVQVPGVVPGIANVYVRTPDTDVSRVSALVNFYETGGNAPPPDIAEPVAGDRGLYHARLWVMQSGSNAVQVFVRGARGEGRLIVPVPVVASQRLTFGGPLKALMIFVLALLFLGMVSIVGAAWREGTLPPGETPDPSRRRRARRASVVEALVLMVVILGGWKWWSSEDDSFRRNLYKPMDSAASIDVARTGAVVSLAITDSTWVHRDAIRREAKLAGRAASVSTPFIPDHGKLMHMFMVREGDMSAFAHLHPLTSDSVHFVARLPQLPPGRYRVYGDVTRESGFAPTLVSSVTIPLGLATATTPSADRDDSWAAAGSTGDVFRLSDGSTMRWIHPTGPIVAGRPAPLQFEVLTGDAKPAMLEPYMGMSAHAVVNRADGAVFVHLHPSGTQSMAAQQALSMRTAADTVPGTLARRINAGDMGLNTGGDMNGMVNAAMPSNGIVSFPYAFPRPGSYRVWVQVRRSGRVLTGVFDMVATGVTA
ncbi:MAG: hypothetical protein ACR2KM_01870 [Gemmatimonadaceae bacterium]